MTRSSRFWAISSQFVIASGMAPESSSSRNATCRSFSRRVRSGSAPMAWSEHRRRPPHVAPGALYGPGAGAEARERDDSTSARDLGLADSLRPLPGAGRHRQDPGQPGLARLLVAAPGCRPPPRPRPRAAGGTPSRSRSRSTRAQKVGIGAPAPRRAGGRSAFPRRPRRRAASSHTRQPPRGRARACGRSSAAGAPRPPTDRAPPPRPWPPPRRARPGARAAGSPASSGSRSRSIRASRSGSSSAAILIASTRPERSSARGRVDSSVLSATTSSGWWKAPTRFLPAAMSIAVLPPIAASICARSVVGSCTKATPRRKVAATKPARSPTLPPPKADDDAVPLAAGPRHRLPEPPRLRQALRRPRRRGPRASTERAPRLPAEGRAPLPGAASTRRARNQKDRPAAPERRALRQRRARAALAGDDPRHRPAGAGGSRGSRRAIRPRPQALDAGASSRPSSRSWRESTGRGRLGHQAARRSGLREGDDVAQRRARRSSASPCGRGRAPGHRAAARPAGGRRAGSRSARAPPPRRCRAGGRPAPAPRRSWIRIEPPPSSVPLSTTS